ECGPARFELDPEGVPAEMDRFDDGGADAAERIDDEIAGFGVVADGAVGEVGQHLARVPVRAGQVAAAPLLLACLLRAGPERERQFRERCGVGQACGAGRGARSTLSIRSVNAVRGEWVGVQTITRCGIVASARVRARLSRRGWLGTATMTTGSSSARRLRGSVLA